MAPRGKKAKNPPILSHEFVIQNHADIVAVASMVFILGLMVEFLNPIASSFVLMQHNVTIANATDNAPAVLLYRAGQKDLLAAFFYLLAMIIGHAVLQEFVLDRYNKKLHLSKVKFNKFNESGQLCAWYLISFVWAANLLFENGYIANISSLWVGYPAVHALMPWAVKLFYVLQISYWLHVFPELYFQKTKREDMPAKINMAVLYLVCIVSGYFMSYTRVMLILLALHYLVEGLFHLARITYFLDCKDAANVGFTAWSVLFVVARAASLSISVLTFWFGFAGIHAESENMSTSFPFRMCALCAVAMLQAWMTWNFITFYMKRRKEQAEIAAAERKLMQPTKKSTKKDNGSSKKKN